MAVKIKLKRLGRTRVPTYRIVVADARTKRDGRAIEEIGKYHPKEEPSLIEVDSERAQHWLSVGAQPTPPVMTILKITGDWQKFKGEPGAEGTLRVREPKVDKKETFANALQALGKGRDDDSGSTTPRGGGRAKKSDAKATDAKAAEAKATDTKATDTKATDTKATDTKATEAKASDAKATETKAEAKTDADVKPESGRAKSKASSEKTAAGSADDSAAAAATADAPAAADSASPAASESREPGSED